MEDWYWNEDDVLVCNNPFVRDLPDPSEGNEQEDSPDSLGEF
jgi:hypothetical protein